ncbi:MAG: radical SAM protein, partial [Candidatus Omnitrophica bacterium]|nr:radical SAM protein [Candidatus Omnitrophota bacterium]
MPRTEAHREFQLVSVSPFGKDFRAVLVFPEPYSVASSNLAFHQIYRLLGQHPRFSCERACVEPGAPVRTLERGRPLEEFDLLAFTVPFELGYLNVVRALDESGVPLLAAERKEGDPLVLMGGIAAAANPAVMAPFVDLFLLGEGEA